MVRKFEGMVREYTGSRHAVAVSSGTSALQAALLALGVQYGDDVVIPSFTHVSTANAVQSVGAKPVFADIGPSHVLTPDTIRDAITPNTKCVIPVHLYGHVADIKSIRDAVGDMPIIEDAAQALGSSKHGVRAGKFGEAGIYSFYPGKVITTGEGGMVVTDNPELYERMLDIRNHGTNTMFGTNLRLPEMSAAIGHIQMSRIADFIQKRRINAKTLSDLLDGMVSIPVEHNGEKRNWNLYTISSPQRNELLAALHDKGIGCAVYYQTPSHLLPRFGFTSPLPDTMQAAGNVLSLPVHPAVHTDTIHEMADIVKTIIR